MWKILRSFINIATILILLSAPAVGQGKYAPGGIRVGVNVKTAAASLFRDYQNQYEVSGDINFWKYLLTVDLGVASFSRTGDQFRYLTEGNYFRIGPAINFIHDVPGNHALGLGLKYGSSSFQNVLNWNVSSPVWGDETLNMEQRRLMARWLELAGMLKVHVAANIQLGLTASFKFARNIKGAKRIEVYDIPGYGLAEAPTWWGFDYYIYYRIPLFD